MVLRCRACRTRECSSCGAPPTLQNVMALVQTERDRDGAATLNQMVELIPASELFKGRQFGQETFDSRWPHTNATGATSIELPGPVLLDDALPFLVTLGRCPSYREAQDRRRLGTASAFSLRAMAIPVTWWPTEDHRLRRKAGFAEIQSDPGIRGIP
jgi:hypothetical protein